MICSYNGKTEEESQDFTNAFARINFWMCNEIHKQYNIEALCNILLGSSSWS